MKKPFLSIMTVILALFLVCISIIFYQYTNLSYVKLNKSDEALGIKHAITIQTTTVPISNGLLIIQFKYASSVQSIDWLSAQGIMSPISKASNPSAKTYAKTASSIIKAALPKDNKNETQTIALFGLDSRSKGTRSRSDVILLLTIDYSNKKLKLSSLMRDLYVHIDGHGYTKLNHAYAYGGPQLALKTLNQNFDLAVRDFCTVDFFDMAKIVDATGGIELDVEKNEIPFINSCIGEREDLAIKKPGLQHLIGAQAVEYSRIRCIGRGDFDRTQRQRRVLEALASKVKHMGKVDALGFIGKVLPYMETSLTRLQIIDMAQKYFSSQPMVLEENRFPMDGTFKSGTYGGIYYIKADMNRLIKQLRGFINSDRIP